MRYCLIVTFCLLIALAIQAQDVQEEAVCDYEPLALELDNLLVELATTESPDATLTAMVAAIRAARIECLGLTFNSETEGMQPVIGPITIPEGMYRVTVTTEGAAVISLEPITGECGASAYTTSMFTEMPGRANPAETLVTSTGCEALIVVGTASEPWTLDFERIR